MAVRCRLAELGERICVLGPSNSGKSTLADAIARKLALKVIHLDQLYHLPNTNWQARPDEQFLALHDEAISGARWVIDGNYSRRLPQRLQRATGIIVLDISTGASLFRYLRRTIFDTKRVGILEGGQDSIKLSMLHHILMVTPANRKRYADLFRQVSLPKVYLPSIRVINACYQEWGLETMPSQTGLLRWSRLGGSVLSLTRREFVGTKACQAAHSSNRRKISMSLHPNRMREPHNMKGTP